MATMVGFVMLPVPSADDLPEYPASWYLFGSARRLGLGPFSREVFGRLLVAFRTASGRLIALDGRCSHQGADLGEGCVVGEELQCAFHHWRYGSDGRCTHIPAASHILQLARQHSYPIVERHGWLFVFNRSEAAFPLPFFADADARDCVAARPLEFDAECPWYMVSGNSFDVQHFRAGHHRDLIETPVVDCPHPHARRMRLTLAVCGQSLSDRLLRRFVGPQVEVSMTNWGGVVVVVQGKFRRTTSRLITFIEPLGPERCTLKVLVYARCARSRLRALLNPLSLSLRRLLTHRFMADEFPTLAGIRYNPAGMIDCDRPMLDFFRWVAGLEVPSSAQPILDETGSLFEESVS
jgi:nitrite reductase/ring-hydroxylating ferredoxin subunit